MWRLSLPQVRHAPGAGGQLLHRRGQRPGRRALVRAAQDQRQLGPVPGGHLCARQHQPLDGRDRHGPPGQHGAGLQRGQQQHLSGAALRGAAGRRCRGHDAAGRVHRRQRLSRQRQQPLRRLLLDERRPGRRLHLLVHRPVEQRQPVETRIAKFKFDQCGQTAVRRAPICRCFSGQSRPRLARWRAGCARPATARRSPAPRSACCPAASA